ncbi:uncharacterized protein LOC123529001 [Mercenaria mercenaria]|uniref:uncharacterized protein LOC123529001 n=1 Tax=Mercenaria mercenaria TaxID=6596 RepID=UPI00234E48BA|nr:uncharacterized protein LOC123529001 [Mercenaria mercenaria]
METSQNYFTPMCSVHNDAVAKAVCLKNKELLCLQCAIGKAKLDAYTIQEIDKISEGKEKLKLEYIVMKQIASRKENFIVEYERKAGEVTENLQQQVKKMYDQLSEELSKLKENTLHSVESKRDLFLKDLYSNKKELDGVQKTINENLEKLSVATVSDVDSFESQLQEVKKKLADEIPDLNSNPEGVFIASKMFQETMSKSKGVLGEVNLSNMDHYSLPTQDESQANNAVYLEPTASIGSQPPKLPPKPDAVASDEYCEKPKLLPRNAEAKNKRTSINEDTSQTVMKTTPGNDITTSQTDSKKTETVAEPKQEKAKKPKFKLFGGLSAKEKPREKLEDYEDVTFTPKTPVQAKYLINRTITLSGLQSIHAPMKFSKLVTIGPDRIGLLTRTQSTVVVAQLDENTNIKPYRNGVTSIAATENDQLAILTKKDGNKIETVCVTDKGFDTKSTIDLKVELSDVTGFDYSKNKSRFAIGTRTKQVIIDGKGKKIKSTDIDITTGSSDIATTYDFENDCIFVLNMEQKSIKCVSLKNLAPVWKRKCEDDVFKPKSVCLYKDKLCVACSGSVTIFAAKDGTPIRKHDTTDLVQDCLGICVIDDVIVISSNSDGLDESRKLGFIGI